MGNYKFKKTIFAVGQGGFSMGVLYANDSNTPLYSYVYDCGSIQTSALFSEMEIAKSFLELEKETIDTVFISHLDADHINGFDKLCELVDRRINKVVLPYLDLEDCYYEASRALNLNATGLFLEFLNDPVRWVKKRLPQAEIILLNPASGDEEDPFVVPDKNNTTDDRNILSTGTVLSKNKLTLKNGYNAYTWMADLPSSSSLSANPILLLAYIPPIAKKKNGIFRRLLKDAGFSRLGVSALHDILCDPIERKKLRECYLSLATDHNIISINLLVKSLSEVVSGRQNSISHREYNRRTHRAEVLYHDWNQNIINGAGFGYIFTGDSKLSINKYYSKWKGFYQVHFKDIQYVSLPHHGSIHNFNPRMLELIPCATFIAQSGSNGHDHPSQTVIDEIINSPFHSFIKVSEDRDTRFENIYIIK